MSMPIGLALLTMMAIAPVLPWRKASQELLLDRLYWPGWCSAIVIVVAVVLGGHGWVPLVAFALAGFAAGAAGRQLVLATRRQGWRGLVGRANGGMVVHLGVILIAVAFAASQSYSRTTELRLAPGVSAHYGGHTFTYTGSHQVTTDQTVTLRAAVLVDGREYAPALKLFRANGQTVPTPSVRTGLAGDVYLTLEKQPEAGDVATIKVLLMPLVIWLWIGGGLMGVGTALAAFPGRRRNPIAPTSAALPDEPPTAQPELVGAG